MRKFFAANIGTGGRIVRAILGLALLVTGVILTRPGKLYYAGFLVAGAFVLFEAIRGWCLVRACGIKTRI